MSKNVIQLVGEISSWGISRNYAKYLLDQTNAGPLTVEISSLGGDVNQALQIKKLFADRGDVTVDYFGYCASASTLLGHGTVKTRIYEDAMYLVHKPLVWVDEWGSMNEDDIEGAISRMQAAKKDAETATLMIAQSYVKNRGIEMSKVMELLEEARWLSAQEAVDLGLVDEVIPAVAAKKPQLTNQIHAMIASNDLPAMPVNSTENDRDENLVQRIVNALKPKNTKTPEMKKDFTFVNQVLGVEGVEVKNDMVTIPVANLAQLDARIKADSDSITNLTTERDTVKTNLDNFTNQIDEIDATVKAAATPEAKVTAITAKLASRPAAPAANTQGNGGEGSVTDSVDWDAIDNLPHNQAADKEYVAPKK